MNHSRLIELIRTHSLKQGDFTLASGKKSHYLIDLKMTALHPDGIKLIADAVLEETLSYCDIIDAFGGMAVGAVPLVAAVCARCVCKPTPGFYVRKSTKGHGTNMLVDGWLKPGMRTVLLEDVITTGGSVLQAVDAVEAAGAKVIEVITIVDRLEGGREMLAARDLKLTAILTREDLGV